MNYPPPPGYGQPPAQQAPAAPPAPYGQPPAQQPPPYMQQPAPPAPPPQFQAPTGGYGPPPGYPAAPPPAYGAPPMGAPMPQQPVPPNALSGIGGGQLFQSGSYFSENETGSYDVKIADTVLKVSQKSGTVVIVEYEIVHVRAGTVPVGTKRSEVFRIANTQIVRQQLLGLMAAILGYDRNNPVHLQSINTELVKHVEPFWQEACDKKSCNGKMIRLDHEPKTTKGKGIKIAKITHGVYIAPR